MGAPAETHWVSKYNHAHHLGTPAIAGVRILPEDLRDVAKLVENDESVRGALEVVKNQIIGDIKIRKKGYRIDRKSADEFRVQWRRFGRDVVDSEYAYGFCITSIDTLGYPVVLSPHIYDVTVEFLIDGRRRYFIASPGGSELARMPLVVVWEFYPPKLSENRDRVVLTSPLKAVVQKCHILNRMLEFAMNAYSKNADPAIFTVSQPNNPASTQTRFDYNQAGDADASVAAENEAKNSDAIAQTEVQQRNIDALNAARGASSSIGNDTTDPITGQGRYPLENPASKAFHASHHPISLGRQLVLGPEAKAPEVLIQMIEVVEGAIGKATGVPRPLWGTHLTPIAVNQQVMSTFYATVNSWRQSLTLVFEQWIYYIFGHEEVRHAQLEYLEKRRKQLSQQTKRQSSKSAAARGRTSTATTEATRIVAAGGQLTKVVLSNPSASVPTPIAPVVPFGQKETAGLSSVSALGAQETADQLKQEQDELTEEQEQQEILNHVNDHNITVVFLGMQDPILIERLYRMGALPPESVATLLSFTGIQDVLLSPSRMEKLWNLERIVPLEQQQAEQRMRLESAKLQLRLAEESSERVVVNLGGGGGGGKTDRSSRIHSSTSVVKSRTKEEEAHDPIPEASKAVSSVGKAVTMRGFTKKREELRVGAAPTLKG